MRQIFSCFIVLAGCGGLEAVAPSVADVGRSVTQAVGTCDSAPYAYQPPPLPRLQVQNGAFEADDSTRVRRSLLVVDHTGFAPIAAAGSGYGLAPLLRDLGAFTRHEACLAGITDHRDDLDDYSKGPFNAAKLDVEQNDAYMAGPRVGSVSPVLNRYEAVLDPKVWPDSVGADGPFRLSAVVARLDLAGDTDSRTGGHFAANERRWFGEGRLVFGTTNIGADGTVLPMTFILEFRLPALKRVGSTEATTDFAVDPDFSFADGPVDDLTWRRQRKMWATVWNELSRSSPTSAAYRNLLFRIVKVFARGENFIALRTGENVRKASGGATTEFEYREFYLSASFNLTSRKVRREPMRCEDNTVTLANHITADWNVATDDFHFDYAPGERTLNPDEQLEVIGAHPEQYPNGVPPGSCKGIPFGNGTPGDIGFRANYVRFRVGASPWANKVGGVERQRHQFAVGTCSGCHATETASPGFHIAPRASDTVDAAVSDFLNQSLAPHPAQVTVNGHVYDYPTTELADRLKMLNDFAALRNFSAEYLGGHPTRQNEMLLCTESPCALTTY